MKPTHLGDGAYVSQGNYDGEIIITANHHNPLEASDAVFIAPQAIRALEAWLAQRREEHLDLTK
jgi:hypothetical protein